MSTPLKSRQGCWSCKLRKKKCDEHRPLCITCKSLSITCYGYGTRPEWMDGGERERAVAISLKDIVKQTSRRKAAAHPKHAIRAIRIAPKSGGSSIEDHDSYPESIQESSLAPEMNNALLHEYNNQAAEESPKADESLLATTVPLVDSVLLMHFMDVVFPLQFPMYNPQIEEGGRGWLLALLLRTKPFYHAAATHSALHRWTFGDTKTRSSVKVIAHLQQEKHFEICMTMINQLARESCPSNGLGILMTVIELMFFELFTGNVDGWKTHLGAFISMHLQGTQEHRLHYGTTEEAWKILSEDLPLIEEEPMVEAYVTIYRFLEGTILWIDTISSITSGKSPVHHKRIISNGTQIKLGDIMGCENWVMLQMGRIADMNDWKNKLIEVAHFDCTGIQQAAAEISEIIRVGLTSSRLQRSAVVPEESTESSSGRLAQRELITRVFAMAALIYLHLVARGFQELELLDTTISEVVGVLQTQTPTSLLTALVAPLFLIGCVAREGEQSFFRTAFSSRPLLNSYLKHREMILPILEQMWKRRKTNSYLAWQDTLDLTRDILLI